MKKEIKRKERQHENKKDVNRIKVSFGILFQVVEEEEEEEEEHKDKGREVTKTDQT